MKITSINETIRKTEGITSIRVDGSYIVLSYGVTDVYYNDQGREVFEVERDPAPVPTPNLLQRFWRWLTDIQLTDLEKQEIKLWDKHKK